MISSRNSYQLALCQASSAIRECLYLLNEPLEYATFRSMNVTALSTGEQPNVRKEAARKLSDTERDSINNVLHKALCIKVKADMALCYEALKGTGTMTKVDLAEARQHRSQVTLCESHINHLLKATTSDSHLTGYDWALKIKPPQVPDSDIAALNTAFCDRLTMHIEACKEAE